MNQEFCLYTANHAIFYLYRWRSICFTISYIFVVVVCSDNEAHRLELFKQMSNLNDKVCQRWITNEQRLLCFVSFGKKSYSNELMQYTFFFWRRRNATFFRYFGVHSAHYLKSIFNLNVFITACAIYLGLSETLVICFTKSWWHLTPFDQSNHCRCYFYK